MVFMIIEVIETFHRNVLRNYRRRWPGHRCDSSWRQQFKRRFHIQSSVRGLALRYVCYILELAAVSPLLNLYSLTGNNLPMPIRYGASVQYQDSFLIIGGDCSSRSWSDRILDTIIKYNEDGEWETLPMRLATGRWRHTVIPKPVC